METLFKTSADVVQQYAANAYKTAGLSANEYMNTVTAFSASLLQSLDNDTAAAAEKADLAITDMSDNANKMGTSMESIQNAYQGFAKQNFTMLDNLKLGYGGTKTEMERLLADAEKLSGVKYDISSYADIVDAIHVIQGEMEISGRTAEEAAAIYERTGREVSAQIGTTAMEASTTIQGSVSAMKSAWTNLITGIADENANLDVLIGNVVDSAVTAGENIIPRVEQILSGIGAAVTRLAPIIAENVPDLVKNVLPSLLDAGVQLIDGLLQGLISALPTLGESAVSIVETLATTIIEQLPVLLESAMQVILMLAGGISESLPELIPTIVDIVIQIVETLIDNVDMLADAAIEIIIALAEGLINAIPNLIEKAPEIISKLVSAIITNAPKLSTASVEIIYRLAAGLISNIPNLIRSIPQIIAAIVAGFASYMSQIKDIGKNILMGVWEGIQSMANWFQNKVSGFFSGIVNGVKGLLGIHSPSKVFASIGGFMAEGLGEGWADEYSSVKKQIENGLDFGTTSIGFGTSGMASAYSESGKTSAGSISGFGPIYITINGADYDNLRDMAKSLMEEMQFEAERRYTAIGT